MKTRYISSVLILLVVVVSVAAYAQPAVSSEEMSGAASNEIESRIYGDTSSDAGRC